LHSRLVSESIATAIPAWSISASELSGSISAARHRQNCSRSRPRYSLAATDDGERRYDRVLRRHSAPRRSADGLPDAAASRTGHPSHELTVAHRRADNARVFPQPHAQPRDVKRCLPSCSFIASPPTVPSGLLGLIGPKKSWVSYVPQMRSQTRAGRCPCAGDVGADHDHKCAKKRC